MLNARLLVEALSPPDTLAVWVGRVGGTFEEGPRSPIIVYSEYMEGLGRTPSLPATTDAKVWSLA